MTTTQQGNFLVYDRALGMTVMEGKGFYYPVDTVAGKDDRLYVISRSKEETTRGIRVTICDLESGYYGNFGGYGFDGGQFVWPSCGAVDSQGRFYISDERLHRITGYSPDGNYLLHWGEQGSGEGQFDTPSGLAFDSSNNLYVADTYNNRVQKFTADGEFIETIGGDKPEGVSLPWGLAVDSHNNVYVADFGNDCIKKFSASGDFLACFGGPGRGDGQFTRPASVAVDKDGYIYVADWGNERVQVLDAEGNWVFTLRGEATLSEWASNFLSINQEEAAARATADLEMDIDYVVDDPHEESSHIEKYFWCPSSVRLDSRGYLYVTETNRHRIQVYRKNE
ncbi:MAG: NHL repeat-containing protein [Chloroflexota bacterium]|nr:NHL repeat-containing protein [Chloroflexota bacterium]